METWAPCGARRLGRPRLSLIAQSSPAALAVSRMGEITLTCIVPLQDREYFRFQPVATGTGG